MRIYDQIILEARRERQAKAAARLLAIRRRMGEIKSTTESKAQS